MFSFSDPHERGSGVRVVGRDEEGRVVYEVWIGDMVLRVACTEDLSHCVAQDAPEYLVLYAINKIRKFREGR